MVSFGVFVDASTTLVSAVVLSGCLLFPRVVRSDSQAWTSVNPQRFGGLLTQLQGDVIVQGEMIGEYAAANLNDIELITLTAYYHPENHRLATTPRAARRC